jgi:hypothetical protein
MQFLLMCCIDETAWGNLPDEERGKIMEDYGKLMAGLHQSGQLRSGAKLDSSSRAATVRQKNGKPAVTDGPFAETKEQLGGYHLIECANRDEALAIAMRFPTLPVGGAVEVREILHTEG